MFREWGLDDLGQGLGFYEVYWRTDVRAASLFCGYFGYIYHRVYGLSIVHWLSSNGEAKMLIFAAVVLMQFVSIVPDPIKYSVGTVMACLVLLSVERRANYEESGGVLVNILEHSKIVVLGRISYSVYLYQQIFHVIKEGYPFYLFPIFALLSLAVGAVSYKLIEEPSRKALNKVGVMFTTRRTAEGS